MANIIYEIEIQRTNIPPKQFFTYCKKQSEKHGLDLESWLDFENWSNENYSRIRI